MCVIAGAVGMETPEIYEQKIVQTLRHRGPDGSGTYREKECLLMHARLAIIDPDGGKQPMELAWAGEKYVIIYNGELYNSNELRQELAAEGHIFSGHSDTETVLHAYAQWGEQCLTRFNGIFAFAVWMSREKRLFLARDRIGVKPLFYMTTAQGVLFASEIKTILAYPGVKAELDAQGAAQIILLGPGRKPGSGVLKNINELEPGCCGEFAAERFHWKRYWRLMDHEHTDTLEETANTVRELLTDAIKRQMVSDVPLGTFLSGGLDSSIISAVCAREAGKSGTLLKTFSVDYLDSEKYFIAGKFQPTSDNMFIRLMQQALHTEHSWTVLSPDALLDCLEDATDARDLPGMADVDFSFLAFCRAVRRDVKVALSGECADEIFGGYPWFRDPQIREQRGFPWAQNTVERGALLLPNVLREMDPEAYVMDAYSQTCKESDILPGVSPLERRMKEMINLNFRWFMQTLLDRTDRMSMQCGLEVRVPFCDYRIVEYMYGVPWEMKDYMGREKGLLRYAARNLLPERIVTRKKSPYPKTHDPRYEQLVETRLQKLIKDPEAPLFGIVSREEVVKLLRSGSEWPWYGQLMRRPQTMAYFLQIDYWLRRYHIELTF